MTMMIREGDDCDNEDDIDNEDGDDDDDRG